jgi:hypothetical protein
VNVTNGATAGTVDIAMAQPCWVRATTKHAPEQDVSFPTDIENAFDLLDESGEWYADFSGGGGRRPGRTIYYLPRKGEKMDSPSTVVVLGGVVSGGDGAVVVVQPGAAVRRIEGIGFQHQTWSARLRALLPPCRCRLRLHRNRTAQPQPPPLLILLSRAPAAARSRT